MGKDLSNSCWEFRADSKEKYGWICEYNNRDVANLTASEKIAYTHFSKTIKIGGNGKVILSRLVSYDEIMSNAQVWFSIISGSSSSYDSKYSANENSNIFKGNPVWNITSWHKDHTSIPEPIVIELDQLELNPITNSPHENTTWPFIVDEEDSSKKLTNMEVTFNIKILVGSSAASQRDIVAGVDKLKLVGLVTC